MLEGGHCPNCSGTKHLVNLCMRLRAVSDVSEYCLPFGAPVDPGSMIVDDGSPLDIIGYSDFEGIFGPWR